MSVVNNLARVIREYSQSGIIWLVHRESGLLRESSASAANRMSAHERAQYTEHLSLVDAICTSELVAAARPGKN